MRDALRARGEDLVRGAHSTSYIRDLVDCVELLTELSTKPTLTRSDLIELDRRGLSVEDVREMRAVAMGRTSWQ